MTAARIKALDLFAGTGWGVACRRLGIKEAGVEIMPEAVATREANGMETIYRDVWDGIQLTAEQHRDAYGSYGLLIASPPCQTFSLAGKGAGRAALDEVLEAIELHAYKDADALLRFGQQHDMRTALVLTPLAYVWRDRPRLIALEQVPTVLPVWEACAEAMREWGYEVKVEVLNSEQYGVPQTRKRAILVARRGGPVALPTPTHSRYYSRTPGKLDPGVKKWVSMAEALGCGATDQPSHTVTSGVHGPTDRFASGGNSVRKSLDAKIGGPNWIDKPNQEVDARTTYTQRFDVVDVAAIQTYPTGRGLTDRPAPTITGGGTDAGGAEPIAKFHERYTSAPGWTGSTERLTAEEAATLQSYPSGIYVHPQTNGRKAIWSSDEPAPTIRGTNRPIPATYLQHHRDACPPTEAHARLTTEEAAALQSYPTAVGLATAEPRPEWTFVRPSTTVVGTFSPDVISAPAGRRKGGYSRQNQPGSVKITADQASTLQSYPSEPPFVFCGSKTKQFLQIGNAVPPLLAEHILAALVGIPTVTPAR